MKLKKRLKKNRKFQTKKDKKKPLINKVISQNKKRYLNNQTSKYSKNKQYKSPLIRETKNRHTIATHNKTIRQNMSLLLTLTLHEQRLENL